MSLFEKLKAALGAAKSTSTDLEAAVLEAGKLREELASEIDRLAAKRRELLLAPEHVREANKRDLAAATERLADLSLYIEELTAKLAQVRTEELQESRRRSYAAAKRLAEETSAAIEREYPILAGRLVSLIRQLANARITVARANAELPDGVMPIVDPEAAVRDLPARLARVHSEEEVRLWCWQGSDQQLSEVSRRAVVRTGPTSGSLEGREVELRTFRRIEFTPHQGPTDGPLLTTMRLPGLRAGDHNFMEPCGAAGELILAALARLSSAPAPQSAQRRIDIVPVDGEGRLIRELR